MLDILEFLVVHCREKLSNWPLIACAILYLVVLHLGLKKSASLKR